MSPDAVAARAGEPLPELVVQMWRGETLGTSLSMEVYAFDFELPATFGWRRENTGSLIPSERLAEDVLTTLLKTIEAHFRE